MKKPLVSIIINCFNGEKFLSKTLQSVLNQKFKDFEVIFLDNCSTDKSAKIYKNIKDERFKSKDTMDRMWFLKVIEELNYVLEVIDKIGVDDGKRRD